jgi:hypothetical protein
VDKIRYGFIILAAFEEKAPLENTAALVADEGLEGV